MKRAVEFVLSLLVLIVLLPIFILIIVLIKLDSSGPAIYKQKRIGINQKIFTIYKFRTMRTETPEKATDQIDPTMYVTTLGRFLRKTSLDELPQLLNILKGDMSIVGPRPALYNQYELIELREKQGVHQVRPGITGLAQINGRDEISDNEKVMWDKKYIENQSISFDIKIILATFKNVILSKNIKG